MSTDEQRRPSTLAGQELLHDLNFDPHQRQRLKGSILAIEAEAAGPSPAAGLDSERLFRVLWESPTYHRWANDKQPDQEQRFRDWANDIAAEYARLSRSGDRDEEEWQSFRWNG